VLKKHSRNSAEARDERNDLSAVLTCPECYVATVETIPADSCQFFYECPSCHAVLRPKPGDCCVFCSYADRQCPSRDRRRMPLKKTDTTPPKDVPADNPEGTMDRFRDGLRRVLAAPKPSVSMRSTKRRRGLKASPRADT
jgi:hypothetical protein